MHLRLSLHQILEKIALQRAIFVQLEHQWESRPVSLKLGVRESNFFYDFFFLLLRRLILFNLLIDTVTIFQLHFIWHFEVS